jgi:hypothetical protein
VGSPPVIAVVVPLAVGMLSILCAASLIQQVRVLYRSDSCWAESVNCEAFRLSTSRRSASSAAFLLTLSLPGSVLRIIDNVFGFQWK